MKDRAIDAIVPIALQETIEALAHAIEEALGLHVKATHMLNPEVPSTIRQHPTWDIAFSNPWHLKAILDHPAVDTASHRAFGRSPLAFAVRGRSHSRRGMKASGHDDIRKALDGADRIAITDGGTSGDRFQSLLRTLGASNAIQKKIVRLGGGEPMRALLRGDVDLAALPLSNVAPIAGVYPKLILPPALNVHIDLSLCLSRRASADAIDLADWLTDEARKDQLRQLGIDRLQSLTD